MVEVTAASARSISTSVDIPAEYPAAVLRISPSFAREHGVVSWLADGTGTPALLSAPRGGRIGAEVDKQLRADVPDGNP
jgi:hypothetical protein